jgi:hypothetical protein
VRSGDAEGRSQPPSEGRLRRPATTQGSETSEADTEERKTGRLGNGRRAVERSVDDRAAAAGEEPGIAGRTIGPEVEADVVRAADEEDQTVCIDERRGAWIEERVADQIGAAAEAVRQGAATQIMHAKRCKRNQGERLRRREIHATDRAGAVDRLIADFIDRAARNETVRGETEMHRSCVSGDTAQRKNRKCGREILTHSVTRRFQPITDNFTLRAFQRSYNVA